MKEYMVIFRTEEDWPRAGKEVDQKAVFLHDIVAAHAYRDNLLNWVPYLTDVQIYEYTGIQYILIERWHGKK